jgi:heparin binding hemagglutinin HbhA
MSENTNPNTNPQSGQDKDSSDLVKELREMGQQLETAFRTAIESDRAKQLQQDIVGGVRELAGQVQSAVKTLQENPRVQQAEQRGRQAVEQARDSKVVDRLENEANKPGGPAAQNVPVEQEPPATGETTRLDE